MLGFHPLVFLLPPLFRVFVEFQNQNLRSLNQHCQGPPGVCRLKAQRLWRAAGRCPAPRLSSLLSLCCHGDGASGAWGSRGAYQKCSFLAPPSDSVFVRRAQRDVFLRSALSDSASDCPRKLLWPLYPVGLLAFMSSIAFSWDALLKCRYDCSLTR